MKKLVYSIIWLFLVGAIIFSCKRSFLERTPKGSLDENTLANKKGVEALLIGAYAVLDGFIDGGGIFLGAWQSAGTNWVYGSVAGGDAHKGSDGADQPDINPIERYEANAGSYYFNDKWAIVYEGTTRANSVLRVMAKATDISANDITRITAEARFLRGHYHFEAKKMWNMVPYIDETITDYKVPNNTDIWPQIEADLKFAYDNLPEVMDAKGRVNKWAAAALYGKALLYQGKFNEAKTVLSAVIASGKNAQGQTYSLLQKFQDNFNAETKNSTESVFAIQYSVNDGAPDAANGGWGDVLNFPYGGGPGGCCGFFQPSQDFVNSYRVDAVTGLPFPDNFNSVLVTNDQGIESSAAFAEYAGPLDSRLDWTVGRRGIPYLDWGEHPGKSWIRDQAYSGPYASKKNVYYQSQQGSLTDRSFWTSGVTANNYTLIRFADVLLMAAESEVEAGSLEVARGYVNQVRARAANPLSWVYEYADPTDAAANYIVGLYTVPWTVQGDARKWVQFERKLELGMEGHRFFDLVRWGTAASVLNAYLTYESTHRSYLGGATFQAGKDEYFPIPQVQIDLSSGTLTQNP